MRARKRGPKAQRLDPRVKQLEAENHRLQRKLQRAETINPPATTACEDASGTTTVVPDDPQHGVILRPQRVLEGRPIVLVNSVESIQ